MCATDHGALCLKSRAIFFPIQRKGDAGRGTIHISKIDSPTKKEIWLGDDCWGWEKKFTGEAKTAADVIVEAGRPVSEVVSSAVGHIARSPAGHCAIA